MSNVMSKNLNKCASQLNNIAKAANPKYRDFLLLNLTQSLSKAVIEIVRNLLKGRITLSSSNHKALKRNRGFFRKVSNLKSWRGLKVLLQSIVNRRALHKVIIFTCDSLLCSGSESEEDQEVEELMSDSDDSVTLEGESQQTQQSVPPNTDPVDTQELSTQPVCTQADHES